MGGRSATDPSGAGFMYCRLGTAHRLGAGRLAGRRGDPLLPGAGPAPGDPAAHGSRGKRHRPRGGPGCAEFPSRLPGRRRSVSNYSAFASVRPRRSARHRPARRLSDTIPPKSRLPRNSTAEAQSLETRTVSSFILSGAPRSWTLTPVNSAPHPVRAARTADTASFLRRTPPFHHSTALVVAIAGPAL
jgi:hypothetical protein